jgi:hypothetical protein
MQLTRYFSGCRRLILILLCAWFAFTITSASAQQVSTWPSGSGNWSPCPLGGGNANWDTCNGNPPQYPNGNFDAVINQGSVTATGASIVGLEIDSGASLIVTPGYLQIAGSTIENDGTITIGAGNGLSVIGSNVTTNLSGIGMVQMNDPNAEFIGGNSTSLVVSQPITGQGSIRGMNSIENLNIISASGGTLEIYPGAGGFQNRGSIMAMGGSTLDLVGQLTWDNHNGIIQSSDQSSVLLQTSLNGGTLVTSGSGNFTMSAPGGVGIGNLTLDGTFNIPTGATLTWNGTITNAGLFGVQGNIDTSGSVTLTGKGFVNMRGGEVSGDDANPLINQQLIHGSGTFYQVPLTNQSLIRADSASPLYIDGSSVTNNSTLDARNGATLELETVVNNSGGTIEAETGSTVIFTSDFNGSINGGTLITNGSGTIQSQNGVLDGTVNIPTNAGMLEVNNFDLFLQGTINNTGTIAVAGNGCIRLNEPTTLTGSGQLTMASTTCISGGGQAFTNQSTIAGAGSIGDSNPMPITNSGTIIANQASPLLIAPNSTGFSNTGKLIVNVGSMLDITNFFNNLSPSGTLTGGTYPVSGILGLPNSIITNAANITLNGASAQILVGNTNALAALTSNSKTGILSLQNGQALATTANLNNAGQITVGPGSSLNVGGTFIQTAGMTTVDGTLSASKGLNLKGGKLLGGGALAGSVSLGGVLGVGDSPTKPTKLSITGSYQEQTHGALVVGIGGTQAGSQYSQLAVSNGASLGGSLTITLLNGFIPAIGDTFTILTGSVVTGQFNQVNGTIINSAEKFEVNYEPSAVTLTVVAGN